MAVFYVFQGETYRLERAGGYVWAPQTNKSGGKNIGYTTMTHIRKGDFILHNENGKIMAVSVAQADCYDADQPSELVSADTETIWNTEGYRVDCEYLDFDVPVKTSTFTDWLAENYIDGSAFTYVGRGKQQYMCRLAGIHAVFLLNQAIKLQTNKDTINNLNAALSDITDDKEAECRALEPEDIYNKIYHADSCVKSDYVGMNAPKVIIASSDKVKSKSQLDLRRSIDGTVCVNNKCQTNNAFDLFAYLDSLDMEKSSNQRIIHLLECIISNADDAGYALIEKVEASFYEMQKAGTSEASSKQFELTKDRACFC